MAEMIENLPGYQRRVRKSLYPWDNWLNGGVWKVVPGEDFTCEVRSFEGMVRQAARARGMKVAVRIASDQSWLAFQAFDEEEDDA